MRKTKIVATLGPASDDPVILQKMLAAGLDVARFNFSHGTHEEHKIRIDKFREICQKEGATVALMADTKGPEIRLGTFSNGSAELKPGKTLTLTTADIIGNEDRVSVSYTDLPDKVSPNNTILLDDGLIELSVESVSNTEITTRVVNGGIISDRKSLNVPGVCLDMPYISAKDRTDVRFFIENDFDIIAASFVRSDSDIIKLREEISRVKRDCKIKIISKIENAEGVRNLDAILTASDGLMVARGDLGVEVAFEELPILQKDMIRRAVSKGKDVITATQMLESMIKNPRPTRAETSDVANAIYDGTGAIMLSGETAMGKYPVEALTAMARIAERTERSIDYRRRFNEGRYKAETSVTNAISHATVTTAHDLGAAAILTVTWSGITARNVSKFRPECPVFACTPDPGAHRQMKLVWGVVPLLTVQDNNTTNLFSHAVGAALESGYVKLGDLVVLTAGVPVGYAGTTNMLKVHVIGDPILAV